MNPTPEQLQKLRRDLEAKKGSPLTDYENFYPEKGLERIDDRGPLEQQASRLWKPVPAQKPSLSKFDEALAQAEDEARREKRSKMTDAEARLEDIRDLQREEKAAKQSEQGYLEQLQRTEPLRQKLETLKERVKADKDWSYGDCEAIEHALQQLTTRGADENVGADLARAAFGIEKSKYSDKVNLLNSKLDELGATKAEIEAHLKSLEPPTVVAPTEEPAGEWVNPFTDALKQVNDLRAKWAPKSETPATEPAAEEPAAT